MCECVCVCTSSSECVSKVTSFKVNISLWKAEFPGNAGSLRSQPSLYFCCLLERITCEKDPRETQTSSVTVSHLDLLRISSFLEMLVIALD